MSSRIISVTLQAAAFSALSTTVAQAITAYHTQKFTFDALSLLSFMVIAVIMTPPNYLYQKWLEDTFPAKVAAKGERKDKSENRERLSKSNTVAKFFLDQSIGAACNTAGFIILAGIAKGMSGAEIVKSVNKDFVPMLLAGWKVWPTVTLANLVVVPFDYRMTVGNVVGVCWGVYVTLRTM